MEDPACSQPLSINIPEVLASMKKAFDVSDPQSNPDGKMELVQNLKQTHFSLIQLIIQVYVEKTPPTEDFDTSKANVLVFSLVNLKRWAGVQNLSEFLDPQEIQLTASLLVRVLPSIIHNSILFKELVAYLRQFEFQSELNQVFHEFISQLITNEPSIDNFEQSSIGFYLAKLIPSFDQEIVDKIYQWIIYMLQIISTDEVSPQIAIQMSMSLLDDLDDYIYNFIRNEDFTTDFIYSNIKDFLIRIQSLQSKAVLDLFNKTVNFLCRFVQNYQQYSLDLIGVFLSNLDVIAEISLHTSCFVESILRYFAYSNNFYQSICILSDNYQNENFLNAFATLIHIATSFHSEEIMNEFNDSEELFHFDVFEYDCNCCLSSWQLVYKILSEIFRHQESGPLYEAFFAYLMMRETIDCDTLFLVTMLVRLNRDVFKEKYQEQMQFFVCNCIMTDCQPTNSIDYAIYFNFFSYSIKYIINYPNAIDLINMTICNLAQFIPQTDNKILFFTLECSIINALLKENPLLVPKEAYQYLLELPYKCSTPDFIEICLAISFSPRFLGINQKAFEECIERINSLIDQYSEGYEIQQNDGQINISLENFINVLKNIISGPFEFSDENCKSLSSLAFSFCKLEDFPTSYLDFLGLFETIFQKIPNFWPMVQAYASAFLGLKKSSIYCDWFQPLMCLVTSRYEELNAEYLNSLLEMMCNHIRNIFPDINTDETVEYDTEDAQLLFIFISRIFQCCVIHKIQIEPEIIQFFCHFVLISNPEQEPGSFDQMIHQFTGYYLLLSAVLIGLPIEQESLIKLLIQIYESNSLVTNEIRYLFRAVIDFRVEESFRHELEKIRNDCLKNEVSKNRGLLELAEIEDFIGLQELLSINIPNFVISNEVEYDEEEIEES